MRHANTGVFVSREEVDDLGYGDPRQARPGDVTRSHKLETGMRFQNMSKPSDVGSAI